MHLITISLVSHGHGLMVNRLVRQLLACPEVTRIILTRNIPESAPTLTHEQLEIINNPAPVGFGANHNAAFHRCCTPYFCVINPDITLGQNPFPDLLRCLDTHKAALAAPLVVAPDGVPEDSIRRFPTLLSLMSKALGRANGCYTVAEGDVPLYSEWIAGMFMLFRTASFRQMNGFDTNFFLYYEDVDICVRLWRARLRVMACPLVTVTHAAQRESHRKWRYMRWHLNSMMRYFGKHLGRFPDIETELLG